jgi:hypothetical protein
MCRSSKEARSSSFPTLKFEFRIQTSLSLHFIVCLMIVLAREISAHGKHFGDMGHLPDSPPQKTCDDLDIMRWDMFIKSGEQTPVFPPFVKYEGRDVHASNRVFRNLCRRWIASSGSVGQYKHQVDLHNRMISSSHTIDDVTIAIYSFVRARGEPLSFFEFLRRTSLREAISSDFTFTNLRRALQRRLEAAL